MAYYLTPVTFEDQHVRPSDDGAAWNSCLSDGATAGFALSYDGNKVIIAPGKFCACGRTLRIDDPLTVTVTATNGYVRLVLTLDTSKAADKCAEITMQTATSASGFAALTQEDLNNGGTVYQCALVTVRMTSGAITGAIHSIGAAHAKASSRTFLLPASSGWTNNEYTARISGVRENTNILCAPSPENIAEYAAAGIYLASQDYGAVTFRCTTAPIKQLRVNLLLM